ncbi:hypothetical protein [Oceanibium sediminis]|uniref:hypothetical protein n=1 Tax=Oceanibium sediminis TaxID=2026339 RepID=UPI001300AB4C|nr:hypothetical protein [Oceanibium sediminis]
MLSPKEQVQAAKIIADPEVFQKLADSDRPANAAFVERYLAWGAAVSENCED